MKSIKTILLSCLLSAGVATSCINEMEESFQATDSYLKVDAMVDGIARAAIDDTNFSQGDAIGLFVRDTEGNDYNASLNCSNIKAIYNGDVWDITTKFPLSKDKEAVVYAYYPYNANINIVGDSIDIDVKKQDDILYGNATGVTYKNQTAKIQFKHALARVTLALTKGTGDVSAGVVKRVSLRNGPRYIKDHSGLILNGTSDFISLQGRMSLKDGIIKRTTDVESVVSVTPQLTISETAQNVDVLLIPYISSGLVISSDVSFAEIVLNIDGYEFKKNVERPHWTGGVQYTYPIIINRGSLYEDPAGEKIYMGFDGDNGKPLYWASYNLGATQPYEEGGYYGWGDPTGTHTEQWLDEVYGNYLIYEKAIQYYGGNNPLSNISGTEYDVARSMWGDGWRIPSENEWYKLINNCTYTQTTQNGVKGYLLTSKINGNTLFLPITTERTGTHLKESYHFSYYWSSNYFTGNSQKIGYANGIRLYNGFQTTWIEEVCNGHSIRPVTE